MIVTGHQPNFLPGESVIQKMESADAVILLDEVQYEKGGYTNRNRLGDKWLTVPIARVTDGMPVNRVRIGERDDDWRGLMVRDIYAHCGYSDGVVAVSREILRPYRMLVGLNLALLRIVLPGAAPAWHFQSHLDGGHAVAAVSEDRDELAPISERLAMMVAEIGGDVYLSGGSGLGYLDEEPFMTRGIEVRYFTWNRPANPSVVERLASARRS